MNWQARDIQDELDSLHREGSALVEMLKTEDRHPTERESDLFDGILAAMRERRSELVAIS